MKLLAWGLTDVGQKREHNEDAFLIRTDLSLFAVADGMGGHRGGDYASRLAVEILEREIRLADLDDSCEIDVGAESPASRAMRIAARIAGHTIFNLAQHNPKLSGMGTTLTSLFFHRGRAYLAHVGDSRAYLCRDGRIEQLTNDHSWIEEQVRSGFMTSDEARNSALRHIITRSVGFEPEVEIDLHSMPYSMGDCFLLCSDGLSNHLDCEELNQLINNEYYYRLPHALVDAANKRGGEDNITIVFVYVANDARDFSTNRGETAWVDQRSDDEDPADTEFDPYAPTSPGDLQRDEK